ncbi:hypothetical protein ACFPOB_22300 [Bosea eneae]|uniref:Uncharacterized protein n=1 Tax=Bosea eneae TaxID=151454 RepID=A0ABW0IX44_9HYPH
MSDAVESQTLLGLAADYRLREIDIAAAAHSRRFADAAASKLL